MKKTIILFALLTLVFSGMVYAQPGPSGKGNCDMGPGPMGMRNCDMGPGHGMGDRPFGGKGMRGKANGINIMF